MIKIIKTTEKEIAKFNKKEWRNADMEYYGKIVNWEKKKFAFKAIENKKTVGTINGKYEVGVLHITEIIVGKEKRNKGIGQKLMKETENFGKKSGAHKIHLITGKYWKNNIKFYKSLGFKKTGYLPKHYLKQDFIIFEKFI